MIWAIARLLGGGLPVRAVITAVVAMTAFLAGTASSRAAAGGLPVVADWTPEHAAHLLRRAGFGGTPEQIEFLTKLGRDKAVDYLLNYESIPDKTIPIHIDPPQEPIRRSHPLADRDEIQQLQAQQRRADQLQLQRVVQWWLETMVSSSRPLQEKMVLFWHGHFTSGHREVKSSRALYFQNELFRKYATGNFRDFLTAVTYDPAMIAYLNTQQNVKGHPNENYARELMELFTMGVGNYTEKDIKEAARALTGIKFRPDTGEEFFVRRQHDFGSKTFLGQTGDFGAEEVIDIILKQPATAEHMARKLWTFFAYEDPEPAVVKALAATFRNGKYEIKPMLREMFRSAAFYSPRAQFTHIKSPVELMIGTARMLEIAPMDTTVMERGLRSMGQQLMQPPNVKGWDGGATWITTSTLYNRYNAPAALIFGTDNREFAARRRQVQKVVEQTFGKEGMGMQADELFTAQSPYDAREVMTRRKLETPEAVVNYYVQRLLQRPIDGARRQVLIDTLKQEIGKKPLSDPAGAAAVRGLVHLILSMPEYQLS